MQRHRLQWVRDGEAKTALLRRRILEGSLHPQIRETAVLLTRSVGRNNHRERVARLHRFVRDTVSYQREPIETLNPSPLTLAYGGDCDCLTILLGSLAWSLRYPFAIQPHGDRKDPYHYSLHLGYPPAETPEGNAQTQWVHAEVSAAAAFGESSEAAAERRAVL